MPFTGAGSYLPTIDQFVAHWIQVNVALGATPLTLRGGYVLATLQTDRTALQTALTATVNNDNTRQTAAADRDLKRAAIKERMRQFRAIVQGQLANTIYASALTPLPTERAAEGTWQQKMDDVSNLWNRINTDVPPPAGFTPPLKLAAGYLLAAFNTDAAALRTAFTAVTVATQNAAIARQQRDDLVVPLRQRLKEYRQFVQGLFPAGHALIQSLPALSPPPGSTPDPVSASAVWDAATGKAVLNWTAASAADLDTYSVRYHPGPAYKAAEEQVVASVPKTATTFATTFGLPAPGSVARFKVYVVTTTGNEKGSNTVSVTRP